MLHTRVADDPCSHPEATDGRCLRCGACLHDVILNGACVACGATDLAVTVKPVPVVPLDRLRRRE